MIRQLFLSAFLFTGLFSAGQEIRVIGSSDSLNIKAIRIIEGSTKYFLLVTSKNHTDSVQFDQDDNDWIVDTCYFSSVQLDGKGKPELVIVHHRHFDYMGNYPADLTITQIWNLDAKQQMFRAETYNYFTGCDRAMFTDTLETDPCWDYQCSYDIDFRGNGIIVLKNLTLTSHNTIYQPDHKPGMYTLQNGQFVWSRRD